MTSQPTPSTPRTTADAIEIGGEAALVKFFADGLYTSWRDTNVPFDPGVDRVVSGFPMRWGVADILIFYGDGSCTVIKARDGTAGYEHVAAGIGAVTLYATQVALARTTGNVRRALLWSSTGDVLEDATLATACELAGVIALPWPSIDSLVESAKTAMRAIT